MSDHIYLERGPGDLITAEDWNELQSKIKADIMNQIETAKQEVMAGTVKKAEDAERLAGQTDAEWVKNLDDRYAPIHHDHEGQSVYRRYIKHFEQGVSEVFLKHGMGRYPLVDTYVLEDVTTADFVEDSTDNNPYKILVYYGHNEVEKYKLCQKIHRDRVLYGYPLEKLLDELNVDYNPCKNLEDVINDLWNAFMLDPNDEIHHGVSPWIMDKCNKGRSVEELKKSGQWEDIHVAMKPKQICPKTDKLEIIQVDYNTLYIQVNLLEQEDETMPSEDLMFLLRI